jgi:hypothetical protein
MPWRDGLGDTSSTTTHVRSKRDLIDHAYSLLQTRPYRLQHISDFENCGIVGIALGGENVPFRSVVSRGVVSLTTRTTQPSNCFFVHEWLESGIYLLISTTPFLACFF